MSKKGFTMVMTAVAGVQNAAEKQKVRTYVNDAKRMITASKSIYKSDTSIPEPDLSTCVIFRLADLNLDDINVGPNSGVYDNNYSYATINYDKSTKTYYYGVQLLEKITRKLGTDEYITYRGITYKNNLSYNPLQADLSVESRSKSLTSFTRYDEIRTDNCTWRIDPTGSNYGNVSQNFTITSNILNENSISESLKVDSIVLSSTNVNVTGASYKMSEVAKVVANIDLSTIAITDTGSYTIEGIQLLAYTSSDEAIGVQIEPNAVVATINIVNK